MERGAGGLRKGREGKGRDGRTSKKKFPRSNKAKQIAGRRVIKGMYGKREEIDQKKRCLQKTTVITRSNGLRPSE